MLTLVVKCSPFFCTPWCITLNTSLPSPGVSPLTLSSPVLADHLNWVRICGGRGGLMVGDYLGAKQGDRGWGQSDVRARDRYIMGCPGPGQIHYGMSGPGTDTLWEGVFVEPVCDRRSCVFKCCVTSVCRWCPSVVNTRHVEHRILSADLVWFCLFHLVFLGETSMFQTHSSETREKGKWWKTWDAYKLYNTKMNVNAKKNDNREYEVFTVE